MSFSTSAFNILPQGTDVAIKGDALINQCKWSPKKSFKAGVNHSAASTQQL